MVKNIWNNKIWFIILVVLSVTSITLGSFFQSDFGTIDIKIVTFSDENGKVVEGKLYRPKYATPDNPLPGVLLMHGFNNDKDTEAPAALEIARRGFVTLAISEIGQGDSSPWDGLDIYAETDMGANASYHFLKQLVFVDGSALGIVGHSMGGSNARKIAAMNPDHDAVVIQSGGPINLTNTDSGNRTLNNYLQLWCEFEDLNSYPRTEWKNVGMDIIAFNTGQTAQVNQDYGTFADGSAQRYAWIPSTHPGGTWNSIGIAETVDWMRKALKSGIEDEYWIAPFNQTYQLKEFSTLIATLSLVMSIIPLASILLETDTFKDIVQPIPDRYTIKEKSWWISATINALIGGITFLIVPVIGLALLVIPFTNLVTGSAYFWWFTVNFIICGAIFYFWFKRKQDVTWYDVGVSFDSEKLKVDKQIVGKTALLSIILFVYMYLVVDLFEKLLFVEFRFMWPVLKHFNGYRFTQFLVYLVPTLLFFLINGGVYLFGQLRTSQHSTFFKTHLVWLGRSLYAMMAGLVLIFGLHYLPLFFLGTAPIFHFIPLAALFQIFLMQALPQFAVMFVLLTYFYQKTGKIYMGSFMVSLIITWIIAISGAYML